MALDLFADTESTDPLRLEITTDGGASWQPVPFTARLGGEQLVADDGVLSGYHGRKWWRARAEITEVTGEATLRWRYTTDPLYEGRGVHVDAVTVSTRGLPTSHGEQDPERFADGWGLTAR